MDMTVTSKRKMTDEDVAALVAQTLQALEEMGGPEDADYVAVMKALAAEATHRAEQVAQFVTEENV